MTELTDRGKAFRAAITEFTKTRRDAKLKGKENDADTASKCEYATWLADAARRVGQTQAVTHVLKATHRRSLPRRLLRKSLGRGWWAVKPVGWAAAGSPSHCAGGRVIACPRHRCAEPILRAAEGCRVRYRSGT
jgi:hypothetical protein